MTDPLDDAEEKLSRAVDADPEEAHNLLRAARDDLSTATDAGADSDRIDELETRIDRRMRALSESDAYRVADTGAAMNPDEETEGT